MRIKFQVDVIDQIFRALDRAQKGYVSYGDFCELAEERRRNIDAFDNDREKGIGEWYTKNEES